MDGSIPTQAAIKLPSPFVTLPCHAMEEALKYLV